MQPNSISPDRPVSSRASASSGLMVDGCRIVHEGTWLKIARIHDEVWLEQTLASPAAAVEAVRSQASRADLFTFAQRLPDIEPRYPYHMCCDNIAVADTADFNAWWESLPQESRKNVRKAGKRGVTLRPVEFDQELVRGIKEIYDEVPVRQGRRFWHYGKDLATIHRENSSYAGRSEFIGAFIGAELVGFLKMVRVGRTARIMQILSKNAHYDKHPMNALLATAVELCARRDIDHLIYGQYVYGNKHGSSVTEFKRRNGFHQVLLPRYYVPFTWRGCVAIAGGLYREWNELLPEPLITAALNARNFAYKRLPARVTELRAAASST